MPKVAFVSPIYNKEAWVAQTIQSIQNQTLEDIEIIIWDDGSTDSTSNIVRYMSDKDPRIKVYGTKENQGISKSLNQAYQLVTAPYICVSSGDDLYSKDRAELTANYFEQWPDIDVIYGNYTRITANGTLIEDKIVREWVKGDLFLPMNQYVPHGFMSIRTKKAQEVPYDETLRYGVDYPWIKALETNGCTFRRIPHHLGYYLWLKSNTSINHRKEIWTKDYVDGYERK